MQQIRVAVIDDEPTVCKTLKRALEKEGYEVETFLKGSPALEQMKKYPFHLVITDLRLPDLDGIKVLAEIKGRYPDASVIVITGYGSIDSAVEAMKEGAYHYVTKPIKLDEIRVLAKGAVERIRLAEENLRLRQELEGKYRFQGMIGNSPVMLNVFTTIKKVAAIDCNVLIQGNSGTGKELVARAIHFNSPRKNNPFVSFNCGAFTEELIANELFGHEKGAFTGATTTKMGLLETANKGTVFLDEIGEMPPSMQVKLLRAIEEKTILRVGGSKPINLDIRIIAATNRDIKEEVTEGHFREDLFHRLNVVAITLPKLADRRDDIPLLADFFIKRYNSIYHKDVKGMTSDALDSLLQYSFPGNVRELENIIERAVALSDKALIGPKDLPLDLQKLDVKDYDKENLVNLEEIEKEYIKRVLAETNYNKAMATKILGLPRTTLWRKMKKYGLISE
jgi:two-component system response regulator AtoC